MNGQVNTNVLDKLNNFSKQGKYIYLYTGGDAKILSQKLIQQNIRFLVTSKYNFDGAQVEIAIDNEPERSLKDKYRISARMFIKV